MKEEWNGNILFIKFKPGLTNENGYVSSKELIQNPISSLVSQSKNRVSVSIDSVWIFSDHLPHMGTVIEDNLKIFEFDTNSCIKTIQSNERRPFLSRSHKINNRTNMNEYQALDMTSYGLSTKAKTTYM